MIRVESLTPGSGLGERVDDLARLRITVFREWPYLYDGDFDYERKYLSKFASSLGAICVAAFDGDAMVGASTGMPLAEEHESIKAPLIAAGFDLDKVFYLAESVLLPDYRGRGLYRRFFENREAHARRLGGFQTTAFCGVLRPEDHPLRPADAKPLDDVWRRFGYTPRDDLVCHFSWKDIDQDAETEKPLRYWCKTLQTRSTSA